MALVGGQFAHTESITGAVVSCRVSEDIISVWSVDADDNDANNSIGANLRELLHLPAHVHTEYRRHQEGLGDKPRGHVHSHSHARRPHAEEPTGQRVQGEGYHHRPYQPRTTTAPAASTGGAPAGVAPGSWDREGTQGTYRSRGYRAHTAGQPGAPGSTGAVVPGAATTHGAAPHSTTGFAKRETDAGELDWSRVRGSALTQTPSAGSDGAPSSSADGGLGRSRSYGATGTTGTGYNNTAAPAQGSTPSSSYWDRTRRTGEAAPAAVATGALPRSSSEGGAWVRSRKPMEPSLPDAGGDRL